MTDQSEILTSFLCENQVPFPTKDPRKGTDAVPCSREYFNIPGAQLGGGHYQILQGNTTCRLTES